MRFVFVVLALLLTSCGGEDPLESRITGSWRTGGAAPTANLVDLTLDRDGKTITGIADVNNMVYDLDGRWQGSFDSSDVLKLDISVTVGQSGITGTGTLSSGAEDEDVTVTGSRTGRSFQMSVNPEAGEALQVSGRLEYNFNEFGLSVAIENIPAGLQGSERRDLQLTVTGTARGGALDLFNSGAAPPQ